MTEAMAQIVLTGTDPVYSTSVEAEDAFYEAFEHGDVKSMMQVWAPDGAVSCVHPLGAHLQGRPAIEQSWRDIFSGSSGMHITRKLRAQMDVGNLVIHCVTEMIELTGERQSRTPITTTNVFRKDKTGWRLVLHHASPFARETDPLSTVH